MRLTVILAALALACVASSAEARPRKVKPVAESCFLFFCPAENGAKVVGKRRGRHARVALERRESEASAAAARILAHPRGCPRRAFCGCGAAVHLFGKPIRSLWLARNWFKFPRTSPAPKMAAVRRHHVFILERHISGKIWWVYDANSGGGKTRMHARSIERYAIVNPHGAVALRGQAL